MPEINSNHDIFALDGESRLKLYLKTEQPQLAVTRVERLTGDASTRQYFRLHAANASWIAAIYQERFDARENTFCTVTELFAQAHLPVPRIVAAAGDYGAILLEDLGDVRLQDWLETASPAERRQAYQESVRLIVDIQAATELAVSTGSIAGRLAFDEAKLMWELEYFYRHYFKNYLQINFAEARENALMAELRAIARELAARPRVLCHRDFHSRNLMLCQGRQYIIDHQDARLGPHSYDLASLLRDPYVELDEPIIAELYNYYVAAKRAEGASEEWAAEFRGEFELMTVQRIVKAIGTYAYQTAVVKNTVYTPYIPRAIATATAAAERLGRFPELRAALAEQAQGATAL